MVTRRRIGARGPNVRTITTSTSRTPSRVITRTVEKRGSKVRSIASSFRPRPPIRVSSSRKPRPIKAIRVRPPPPQISSRPKPSPQRFDFDFARGGGRPFGDDHILPNRTSSGPSIIRFQEITRPFQKGFGKRNKKRNPLFSPISQDVIGFESTLVSKQVEKPRKRFSTDIFGVF